MKLRSIKFAILILIAFLAPIFVFAHQPRIVKEGVETIQIENPEISQAFYASLSGKPHVYEINSEKPFTFYVNILTPQIANATSTNDFSAMIYYQKEGSDPGLMEILAGPKFEWSEFHEPFANDDYFKGPEFWQDVEAGKYLIKIIQPNYEGKYVLAIGKKEEFPIKEILKTLWALPQEKKFFNKSIFSILSGEIGKYIFIFAIVLILLGLAIFLAIKLFKKK